MTSLFFVMLVLFIMCIVKMKLINSNLQETLNEANASKEQLEQILQLDKQFEVLSKSSELVYIEEKKTFVAKDFIGVEIFNPNDDTIKKEFTSTVDKVGLSLQRIVKDLYEKNPQLSFQMIIEGNAAIPYEDLVNKKFNPDSYQMYLLSYRRALALYLKWKSNGLNFRKYNTEVLISGSGFNGINRDLKKEDNNKRFVIQIIPKISKPAEDNQQIKKKHANKTSITNIEIHTTKDLSIYYPQFKEIEFAVESMPSQNQKSITFCCGAAYTGKLLKHFEHANIAGNHVANGILHKGYPCMQNTGCFVFYKNKWKFSLSNYENELILASKNKGMGFAQTMIIYNYEEQNSFKQIGHKSRYRALCEYKNKLCVIEAVENITPIQFISLLKEIGIKNALNLNSGEGWNYAWFRDNNNTIQHIHLKPSKDKDFRTNWIVFTK